VILRLPFGIAAEAERRTQVVWVVVPQRQFEVVTFDFDTPDWTLESSADGGRAHTTRRNDSETLQNSRKIKPP
jgi:hypothetical protein